MTEIIAVTNQKGGVGKTTTAINLASSLTQKKHKILLIDCDPQGNASSGVGINKNELEHALPQVLLNECNITEAIIQTAHGFDVLPTNSDLTAAEVHLVQSQQGAMVLKNHLKTIENRYEYIIIDCPPALNTLTLNTLSAATQLIIPMQCEYFALEGLTSLIATMQQVQQHLNPQLKLLGILRTMFDPRNRLAAEVSKQLLAHFKQKVFKTCIPKNVKLAEAPSHGLPVYHYAKYSEGAKAYMVLAEEITSKEEIYA